MILILVLTEAKCCVTASEPALQIVAPLFFVVVLCLHVLCHAAKCNLSNQCGVLTVPSQSVSLCCLFLKPTQRLIVQVEGWMDGWMELDWGRLHVGQMLALLTSYFLVNIFFKKFLHTLLLWVWERNCKHEWIKTWWLLLWTAHENKAHFSRSVTSLLGFQLYHNQCFHFLKENTNGKHLKKLYTHVLLLFVDMILKSLLLGLWTDLLWGWRHRFPWRTGSQHQLKGSTQCCCFGLLFDSCLLALALLQQYLCRTAFAYLIVRVCCRCFSPAALGRWEAAANLILQEQSNVVFARSSELIHCSFLSPAFRSASCRNSGMWRVLPSPVPEGGRGCRAGEKCVPLVTHAVFC